MKKILQTALLLASISNCAFAGFPPTTSKATGDSTNQVTFNYLFPNFTVSRTGVSTTFNVNSIAGGGTGQATANAGFGALSPLTTKGDVLGFSTVNGRLGIGADGTVMTADAASTFGFKWSAAATGTVTSVSAPTVPNGFTSSIANGTTTPAITIASNGQATDLYNIGISATISSSTLVVALKQSNGSSDCSAASPCIANVRSTTATTGSYSAQSFTAATSITLAAADSIGAIVSVATPLFVYLISDTTSEICLSNAIFDERVVQSATALTAGADTTSGTLYCTSAHTTKPVRLIAKITATWSNPNWGTLANVNLTRTNDPNLVMDDASVWRDEVFITSISSCTSTPCTAVTKTAGITSVSHNSTGDYTVNFGTAFSSNPACSVICTQPCVYYGGTSTSTFNFVCRSTANANTDSGYQIRCSGPR